VSPLIILWISPFLRKENIDVGLWVVMYDCAHKKSVGKTFQFFLLHPPQNPYPFRGSPIMARGIDKNSQKKTVLHIRRIHAEKYHSH
jgi:hypothetical protein